MALGLFVIVIRRWNSTKLIHGPYQSYNQLAEYLPEETFNERMAVIQELTHRTYPHLWPNTLLFAGSVALVVFAAVFAVVANAIRLSLWYPLLILIVPGIMGFWSSRRRSRHPERVEQYHNELKDCLKIMSFEDYGRQIKWGFRRLRESDNIQELCLGTSPKTWNIDLVIEVIQIDPEATVNQDIGEALPLYGLVAQDVVLEIGPAMQEYGPGSGPIDALPDYHPGETHVSLPNQRQRQVDDSEGPDNVLPMSIIPSEAPPDYSHQNQNHNNDSNNNSNSSSNSNHNNNYNHNHRENNIRMEEMASRASSYDSRQPLRAHTTRENSDRSE
ncbi:hypothetical protein J3Q64DRAFT_1818740 [Phycomyces blakesleeanus]|uniref:Uncharacterized protein n=2 Tax=Phycomyces blakesleeanus TaxID=4837 RepID=A0A162WGU7_PHYB8|nr:hypothetical protein PHYBLDRAFT_79792 [Phycomyces blakesleeanus NRRL 1555(-)]OAD67035.1 hypothetical protein PHYBLDRAFT_79792 [Phycomyces blakesleeanus NRRL 1555(-)]|eukprot:XP_018285075.1 hypothetical protein PHYBLDRAFT_79792 [Phycomyces blakesleeanus NRRL 1555(-)]